MQVVVRQTLNCVEIVKFLSFAILYYCSQTEYLVLANLARVAPGSLYGEQPSLIGAFKELLSIQSLQHNAQMRATLIIREHSTIAHLREQTELAKSTDYEREQNRQR